MAEYIFQELDQFHFDNPQLEELFETYKKMFVDGLQPNTKTMLYHSNESIRNLVIQLSMQAHELSTQWDKKMEGMNILNRDVSRQDVLMSINYYKLRKLKKMFEENQRDMENAPIDEQMRLIELHQHLKSIEREITKQLGTVIIK
jgi:DNA primase